MTAIHLQTRTERPASIIYTDFDQRPGGVLIVAVRSSGDPSLLTSRVREVVASVDPSVAPYDLTTTGQTAARQIASEAALARLSKLFSLSALLLATLGLYGLVSHSILRQRRELGIRLALGAKPKRLVRKVMGGPVRLAIGGPAIGAAASMWLTRLIAPLLYQVEPTDPVTWAVVVSVVLAVAAGAAYVPARGVLGVDPAESLRSE